MPFLNTMVKSLKTPLSRSSVNIYKTILGLRPIPYQSKRKINYLSTFNKKINYPNIKQPNVKYKKKPNYKKYYNRIDNIDLVEQVSKISFPDEFLKNQKIHIVIDLLNFLRGGFGTMKYVEIISSLDKSHIEKLLRVNNSIMALSSLIYSFLLQNIKVKLTFVIKEIKTKNKSKIVHINNYNTIKDILNQKGNGIPMNLIKESKFYSTTNNKRKDIDDVVFSSLVSSYATKGYSVLAVTADKSMTGASANNIKDINVKRCYFKDSDIDNPHYHIRTVIGDSNKLFNDFSTLDTKKGTIIILSPHTYFYTFVGSVKSYKKMLDTNKNKHI